MPKVTGLFRHRTADSSAPTKAHAPAAQNGIPPLYAHQRKTVELLGREDRVFDTSDPGTGKTRAAYTGWQKRRQRRSPRPRPQDSPHLGLGERISSASFPE